MSAKLYLHIGSEKTGTTSIQRFLRTNRAFLGKRGVLYPISPGKQNHTGLAIAAQDENERGPLRAAHRIGSAGEVRKFRESLANALAEELRGGDYTSAIMSGEHCSSRLCTRAEVEWLKTFLGQLFGEIRVIIYIRRQDDFLLSTYSTNVKGGRERPLAIPTGPHVQQRYDYWNLLSRWASVFGRDRIVCRKFERRSLKKGDVVADFLDAVGAGDDLGFEQPQVVAESLDANTLEYLRLFNKHMPRFDGEKFSKTRQEIVSSLAKLSKGALPTLPEDELDRFMAQFAESNRRVAVEYFGGELEAPGDPLFSPRSGERERIAASALTIDRAMEISASLLNLKQMEIDRLRKRMKSGGEGRIRKKGGKAPEKRKDRLFGIRKSPIDPG